MKKIEFIIKPFQLDEVKDALTQAGIRELVVTDIRCSNSGDKDSDSYLTDDYFVEFLPKIRIEIFITDSAVKQIVEAIKKTISSESGASSSSLGKVFVYEVIEA